LRGENLNKWIIYIALAMAGILVGAVAASIIANYNYNQTANIDKTIPLTIQVNGVAQPNGTDIAWGTIGIGNHTKQLLIRNDGAVNVTVTLLITGIPENTTQTWTGNNTLIQQAMNISAPLTWWITPNASDGAVSLPTIIQATT
jgi:hypothetical protein